MTETEEQILDRLKFNMSLSTDEQVLTRALHLLDWVVNKTQNGYTLLVAKGDDIKKVEFANLNVLEKE